MSEIVATVVMPVRNEEPNIAAALDAVLAQDLADGAIEILVIDGQSTDRTLAIVAERSRGARFPVHVLENPERIAATALNAGIAAALSEVLVRVDGHAEIPPTYVRLLLEALKRTGADVVGGAVEPVGETLYARSVACAMRSPLGHGGALFRAGGEHEMDADTVAFPAYRRAALREVAGFAPDMVRNQDDDLHLRLRTAGKRIVFVPGLVTTYHSRGTRLGLFRQYFGYGYWKVVGWRKRGGLSSQRALVPAVVVGAFLLWTALCLAFIAVAVSGGMEPPVPIVDRLRFAYMLVAPVWGAGYLLYAIPMTLVSLLVTPRPRGWLWLLAPPARILPDMHFAYGLGFWWGIVCRGRVPTRSP